MRKNENLRTLFNPKNIAIVGFSLKKEKLGHLIYENIIKGGFKGDIFLVNIKGGEFEGKPIYLKLSDIPSRVDLAVVVIPARFVPAVVEEAVENKVKSIVVISAGFKEIGARGKKLEDEIQENLKKGETRLLGVNCLGLVSYADSNSPLNATFLADMPNEGEISFISQSGAFIAAMVDWSLAQKIGFRYLVSLGNKTDINELDLLDLFGQDKKTKVIALYLEGINDGREFIGKAASISRHKPIIALVPGSSERAKKAVSSHTGSMVSDSLVTQIAFSKAGIIQVKTVEEMFTYLLLFSAFEKRRVGLSTAIVTNAGGPAIVVSDLLDYYGFKVPELEKETQEQLRIVLPEEASVSDPIDVVGDADAQRYKVALESVIADRNVDNIIVLLTPQVTTEVEKTAQIIADVSKKSSKPIIAAFVGGLRVEKGHKFLLKMGIPAFYFPDNALKALKAVYDYQHQSKNKIAFSPHKSKIIFPLIKSVKDKIEEDTQKGEQINPFWFWQILKRIDLPLPRTKFWPLFNTSHLDDFKDRRRVENEIHLITKELSYPFVVKLVAPRLSHKTEVGAVKLGIKSEEELLDSIVKMAFLAQKLNLIHKATYVLIQEELKRDYELIAGLKKDPNFGYVLMMGAGGTQAEVYNDVQTILLPASENEIKLALSKTKIFRLLTGYRGGYNYNIEEITKVLFNLSKLPLILPSLRIVDFNPLILNKEGIFIADAKGYF